MIPILYATMTEGTVPNDYGLGALSDCISCKVREERNGAYELTMDYPMNGIHAGDIAPNKFIKAQPNFTDDPQIFRIYKVGKSMNGVFSVFAQHISYDLSGKTIVAGSTTGSSNAVAMLTSYAGDFTITTTISSSKDFKITEPSSVRSWLGGKEGSLLDFYKGELKYDNYTVSLLASRGTSRGVIIRYGKNLTELQQDLSIENLCTAVQSYYVDPDGNVTVGPKLSTGLVLDVPKEVAIDFSDQVNPDSGTAIGTQLYNLCTAYINSHNLTNMVNSITLDFVQVSELKERVDLCDTVQIYFSALGISAQMKCIETVWDVLLERYESTTFGDSRTNIADSFSQVQKDQQKAVTRNYLAEAVNHATELITGNLGGYVILHDSDGNGEPDEILIMDTDDISTATKVWRWNASGLGYSSTGYAGTYGLAMTADGEIVADYISTGTLNADLIKAGVIEDVGHNSSINMTTGEAILDKMKSKTSFTLIDENDISRAGIGYTSIGGTAFSLYDDNGQALMTANGRPAGYGQLAIGDSDGDQLGTFTCDSSGAKVYLKNQTGRTGSGVFITDEDGHALASVYSASAGGLVSIQEATNNNNSAAMFVKSDGCGQMTVYDSTGAALGSLVADPTGAYMILKDTTGNNGSYMTIVNSTDQVLLKAYSGQYGGILETRNASNAKLSELNSAPVGGKMSVYNTSGNNGAEIAVKDSTAAILGRLYSSGAGGAFDFRNSSHTSTITGDGNSGNITCVSVTQTSSEKVKKNIKPIADAEKILELQAVSFDFKDVSLGSNKRGFIAEEVAKVLPNLVIPEREDAPASLDYLGMIPYLQEMIKIQAKKIKELEDKINGTD